LHLYFIETNVFTKRVIRLGLENELHDLQGELLANPAAGDTDAGTGGLRKIRMRAARPAKGNAAERERIISILRRTVSSTCCSSMARTNNRP